MGEQTRGLDEATLHLLACLTILHVRLPSYQLDPEILRVILVKFNVVRTVEVMRGNESLNCTVYSTL
jgi:hypothetical protein